MPVSAPRTPDKIRRPRTGLGLRYETAIMAGLGLKLALAVFLLMAFGASGTPTLQPRPALAQDQAAPAAGEPAAPAAKDAAAPAAEPAPAAKPTPTGATDDREAALRLREQRIKEREAALDALEKQIDARMQEIESTRRKLAELVERQEQLVKQQQMAKDARIQMLVEAYKGMRAEQAGNLVNSLEDDVAVAILSNMTGRSAGQILANVEPKKAARITKAISLIKPEPGAPPTPPASQ